MSKNRSKIKKVSTWQASKQDGVVYLHLNGRPIKLDASTAHEVGQGLHLAARSDDNRSWSGKAR